MDKELARGFWFFLLGLLVVALGFVALMGLGWLVGKL